jgi:hypothetical protein
MGQRQSTDHFDLLPYIAILMCTLGTLLLLTLSMTAINLGPNARIGIIPTFDTNAPSKIPVLIEWDGLQVIVHHEGRKEIIEPGQPQLTFEDGALKFSETGALKVVMSDLRARTNTHYALFAVRPSGFSNFISLRARFDREDISIGYEPFEQARPVELLMKEVGLTNQLAKP